MKLALLIALFVVVGCATPEQRAERQMATFGPYCDKLGYKRDTDQWRQCVQTAASDQTAAAQRAQQISNQILYGK